jgi:hypothetical protein
MAGGKRSGDDDTSKDRVVIQRVICEVGGGSSYLAHTKTNYSDWAILMKVKLKVRALWSIIENGDANQQKEMMALDALCGMVPPEMVPTIAKKDTTKEAWDTIMTMMVGDDRMKKATTQQLRQKFDVATFDGGEIIEDYALHLIGMAAHLATLCEEVKDCEFIAKMLRSLLPRFKQITITIKTLLDVLTMSVADLTGQLKEAFEEAPTLL